MLAQAAAAFPTHRSDSVLPQPMDATRSSLSSKSSVTPPLKAFCFWSQLHFSAFPYYAHMCLDRCASQQSGRPPLLALPFLLGSSNMVTFMGWGRTESHG